MYAHLYPFHRQLSGEVNTDGVLGEIMCAFNSKMSAYAVGQNVREFIIVAKLQAIAKVGHFFRAAM